MGVRLPRVNVFFNHYTNAQLGVQGQAVVDGLTASVGFYPAPPVTVVLLQGYVNDYNTALADSIGGSARQRALMHYARNNLRNALRSDAIYVNQVGWTLIQAGGTYEDVTASMIASGYQIGKDPIPAGPLPAPVVRKWSSPNRGQLYILLERVVNAKGYIIVLGSPFDPAAPTLTFPNSRILIAGMESGTTVEFTCAAIGTNTSARNFSETNTQVII